MATHVRIITRDLSRSPAPVTNDVVIDHDEQKHRVWLAKHAFWAARANHAIESIPTDEPVTFKPRRMP